MNRPGRRGGLLLSADGGLAFLPASIVVSVAPAPRVTPVPGAPRALRGVTLLAGAVVPVIGVGPENAEMVICSHAGELVGLIGGRVVATGTFDVATHSPTLVEYEGQTVPPLDLHSLYASAYLGQRAAPLTLT